MSETSFPFTPRRSPTRSRPSRVASSVAQFQRDEWDLLDRVLDDVGSGESRALVLRGEAGIGKTALLEYVSGRAAGWRSVRAAGVESEQELAFAALHQVCAPLL